MGHNSGLTKDWLEEYVELRGIWRKEPVLYAKQRLGLNPTWQQAKILEAVAEPGAKVTVRSGHGIGKSAAISSAMWWKLECFDFPKIPCTAPSASQLRDILWSELSRWYRTSNEISERNGLPVELWLSSLFEITQDRVADRSAPKEWFAVARTARAEKPDALQGFHASNVTISDDGRSVIDTGLDESKGQIMFVVEEAPGVSDQIFEVAEGALSSHGATLLMAGNPTKNSGYFANSHKKNRSSYTPLHFRASDSPLVDKGYRPRLVRNFGEGSNVVRVRADGEFPLQDNDVLIPLELAEAALDRDPEPQTGDRRLGIDAARFGDDRTVFVLRQGARVEHVMIFAKQDTMATVGQAVIYYQKWLADTIFVDTVGLGSGVYDRLKELGFPVVSVNASESPPNKLKRYRTDAQPYKLRDYLWMEVEDWLREDKPSFFGVERDQAQDLAGELSTVKFTINSSGRLVIESKADMKKRGLRSPDIADALGTTFADNNFVSKPRGLAFAGA